MAALEQKLSYYFYNPSLPAAAVFAALYGISFILTTLLWIKHRAWVCAIMVLASAMETIGYIGRCLSIQNVDNKSLFVLQFSLVVLAPVLVAGFCYIIFGRIVFLVVPKESRTIKLIWVPPRFVTPIFVACDICALLLQLSGAVMISSTQATDTNAKSKLNRGKAIAQTGVIIQLIAFGLFTVVAIRFNFTSKRFIKSSSAPEELPGDNDGTLQIETPRSQYRHWPPILRVVNLVSGLILIRTIYRMVEFSEGSTGFLNTHEWTFYVFDPVVMFPCFVLFIYWHPAKYLPYLGFRLPKHAR